MSDDTPVSLVRELAAISSFDISAPDGWQVDWWCIFCGSKETHPKTKQEQVDQHEPTCLWRRANELIGVIDG